MNQSMVRLVTRRFTPTSSLSRQSRTAIGRGGPDLAWKETFLSQQYRREGPVKKRLQQIKFGKDEERFASDKELQESRKRVISTRHSKWPKVLTADQLSNLFRCTNATIPGRPFFGENSLHIANEIISSMEHIRGRTVIIVGSGTGALAIEALEQGAKHVVGIDISQEWEHYYNSIQKASDGRFTYALEDALEVDIERVLTEQTKAKYRSWETSEVVILSFLPRDVHRVFWIRICTDLEARKGFYSFGSAPYYAIVGEEDALPITAKPHQINYGEITLQACAYFDVKSMAEFCPRPLIGARSSSNYRCGVISLIPRTRPIEINCFTMFQVSKALFHYDPVNKQFKQDGKKLKYQNNVELFFRLRSVYKSPGVARRILDESRVDGGTVVSSLNFEDAFEILKVMSNYQLADSDGRDKKRRSQIGNRTVRPPQRRSHGAPKW